MTVTDRTVPDDPTTAKPVRQRSVLLTGRGLAGTLAVAVVVAAGLLAPWLAPYGPDQQFPGETLAGPSSAHLLGTDSVGRDVLSRTL